ncbi:CsgE family curli-type amyloid fiber assembly protein [Halomonas halmophila]|uniref:Curli production assembly/transport component CsgE n=1 Tax=Halomonas halmophila TaxID=252 RepID=A0A4Y4F037_9GAMM|nr:CsgE family curli-type amyloid fiber assembly protein [Halomonas halmophila]GED21194.1 hypothetical protein HHA01_01710 [Halomonas halmophila]
MHMQLTTPGCALFLLLSWPLPGMAQEGGDAASLDGGQQMPEVTINDENAQEALDEQFNLDTPELSGVIVDRTMTMAGRTFYRSFAQAGRQSELLNGVVLTLHERPDPRSGSQIWITEGNTVHFRTQLSPRISEADRNAQKAVAAVEERLLRARLSEALQPSRDLADKEL